MGCGPHDQIGSVEGEDAGERDHAGPSGAAVFGFGAGLGDPSPEDAVAVGVELGLGGVVGVLAVVEFAGAFGVEEQGLSIERAGLPDGFALRETVAEYLQQIKLSASELKNLKVKVPEDMPRDLEVTLYGGGALIFNEYGRLKFHVRNRVNDEERQTQRLKYLWEFGFLKSGPAAFRFSSLHRQRMISLPNRAAEEW